MVKEQVKLKKILESRSISAYKMANDTGIAHSIVYNCLNGKQYIYPKWRKKIAAYLELPEEEIFIEEV